MKIRKLAAMMLAQSMGKLIRVKEIGSNDIKHRVGEVAKIEFYRFRNEVRVRKLTKHQTLESGLIRQAKTL